MTDLTFCWPAEWGGLPPDRCLERADVILFLRQRSEFMETECEAEAADELRVTANMLSAGDHQGCYLQHSAPPPAGWENCYPRPLRDRPLHPFAASLKPAGDDVPVARYLISDWCYERERSAVEFERLRRLVANSIRQLAAAQGITDPEAIERSIRLALDPEHPGTEHGTDGSGSAQVETRGTQAY